MTHTTMVDSVKCALLLACVALFLLCGVSLLLVHSWIGAIICLLISLPYAYGAILNSARISITDSGIRKQLLWMPAHLYRWEEIAELGVFGSKIFGPLKESNAGTLYIYVSLRPMDEDQRFQMALRRPAEVLCFAYKPQLLDYCRSHWEGKVASFNVGQLVL